MGDFFLSKNRVFKPGKIRAVYFIIFASTFIPLTFLAGIYGMNFEHFPELGFKYSYLIFWIIVICVVTGLLIYFKRKKWL